MPPDPDLKLEVIRRTPRPLQLAVHPATILRVYTVQPPAPLDRFDAPEELRRHRVHKPELKPAIRHHDHRRRSLRKQTKPLLRDLKLRGALAHTHVEQRGLCRELRTRPRLE
jgi:hypothetical protein